MCSPNHLFFPPFITSYITIMLRLIIPKCFNIMVI
nr:MAG TPA: hypothetical protein [Caudoviricetes sp.]